MDIVLLALTIVSMLVALVMSVSAWRASREARARSAARVAALAAAAADEHPAIAVERSAIVTPPRSIVVNETRPAPWAPARAEQRPTEPLPSQQVTRSGGRTDAVDDAFLGSAVATPASSGRQRSLAIAAGFLFVAIVTGGYFTIYGDDTNVSAAATTASRAESPLELISLRHERRNAGLAITGLVRNPSRGAAVDNVDAVVFLFDQQGRFVTSARAAVDYKTLTPGDESPFVISLDAESNVARYRVSFRTAEGVVPHVDRRGQEPIAKELP